MSKLLTTRRGHDSEDDYSDSEVEETKSYISIEIEIEEDSSSDEEEEETDSEFETDSEEEEQATDSEEEEEKEEEEEAEAEHEEQSITPVQEQVVEETKGHVDDDNNTSDTPNIPVEELDYEATKEKRIQEHREYRRKLAEDPSFVPYVGLFWSHDDRYREDSLGNETRPSATDTDNNVTKTEPYFNPSSNNKKNSYDRSMDPLMYKKWDHSGYEELLRLDEEDERRKREMIESGQKMNNNRQYHNKFAQRGRGNRGGRGGYQNNGQRYSNFNSHRNRNNNYNNKNNHGAEEWPELSSKNETTITVENNTWATATPDTLQEHGSNWGILADVDTPVTTASGTATPKVGTPLATLSTPRAPTKSIDVKFAELVDVSPFPSSAPTVNAWGSVDRVEEKETLGNAITTTVKVDESDGWGTPDPAATSEWSDAKKPECKNNTSEKTQWNNDNSIWNTPTCNNTTTKSTEKETKVATNNWDDNDVTESLGNWGSPATEQQLVESVEMVPTNSIVSSLGWVPEVDAEQSDDNKPTTLNQFMDADEGNGWANTTPTTPTTIEDDGWGAANTTTESKDWNDAKPTSSAAAGWGEVTATATTENTASWSATTFDAKDVTVPTAAAATTSTESSWGASPAATTTESTSSGWGEPNSEKPKQNGWTSEPTTVRSNGWSTNQSSNSTNWNADKKANARYNNPSARKGRGYLSQKLESPPAVEEPKAQVYHGDEDSDVEIILEADEEPDWVKNEEILGMTAPGEEEEETPIESPKRQVYRNYDSSSPQPEYSHHRKNYPRKPRRNFDENWRQRDNNEDIEDTRVPMYYPQPHHHQMNGGAAGNITYLPMIPNGPNGSPMYAMPFPMGSSPVAGGSVSPNSTNGGDSSPHISQKFYPPMVNGPNGLQLPPGYEANGMVYYGMDPSAIYAPQPFYYYAPMPATNDSPMFSPYEQDKRASPKMVEEEEDGWGPSPDVEGEEQWKKSVPVSPQPPTTTTNYNSTYYVYSQQQQ